MASMNTQLAGHTLAFYEELDRRAVIGTDGERTFVGNLTEVYNYLGISSSMYSRVRRILIETGAIEITQRGTGAQPTVAILNGRPDAEHFTNADLTSPRRLATLIAAMEKRIAEIEVWRESINLNIPEVLREHENRLNNLERKE